MDTTVPKIARFRWPKALPTLTSEQQAISDDFMKHWHEILPRRFGMVERFNHGYPLRILPQTDTWKTLELGAGTGTHLQYEDLSRQDYHCIELRENMAEALRRRTPRVTVVVGDCQQRIPYPDVFFDRVVVIHVLEHLPDLPRALDEVRRVLKPGGLFNVVLPCDPGLAYEIARKISAERIFRKRYRIPYGWLIRREHINSPPEITDLLRKRFEVIDSAYFPFRLPVSNLNLCIGMTLRNLFPIRTQN